MPYPDFLIIGAMKCGTTTLAAQLGRQDGVFMSNPKELFYFSNDEVYARGADWYRSQFEAAAAHDLKGEASTRYTMLPTYPHVLDRMKSVLPRPKLVYMMRNPVRRFVSHYMHEWIERRIRGDIADARDRHPELVAYGRYGMQLAPFVDVYGPGAIFLSSLERMQADPNGELARIGAHLGMTTTPVWKDDVARLNVSTKRFRKLPMHRRIVGNPIVRALRRTVVPAVLDERIKNARRMPRPPAVPGHVEDALWDIHRAECEHLLSLGLADTSAVLESLGQP